MCGKSRHNRQINIAVDVRAISFLFQVAAMGHQDSKLQQDWSIAPVNQTGQSCWSTRQIDWTGHLLGWSIRLVNRTGQPDGSIRLVSQADRPDKSLRPVNQTGQSDRSTRQVNHAGQPSRSIGQLSWQHQHPNGMLMPYLPTRPLSVSA